MSTGASHFRQRLRLTFQILGSTKEVHPTPVAGRASATRFLAVCRTVSLAGSPCRFSGIKDCKGTGDPLGRQPGLHDQLKHKAEYLQPLVPLGAVGGRGLCAAYARLEWLPPGVVRKLMRFVRCIAFNLYFQNCRDFLCYICGLKTVSRFACPSTGKGNRCFVLMYICSSSVISMFGVGGFTMAVCCVDICFQTGAARGRTSKNAYISETACVVCIHQSCEIEIPGCKPCRLYLLL